MVVSLINNEHTISTTGLSARDQYKDTVRNGIKYFAVILVFLLTSTVLYHLKSGYIVRNVSLGIFI